MVDNSACACVAGYYLYNGCVQCPAHTTSAQGSVGVPVANIQVVGITPVNPHRRLLDATHQVILTIPRVNPARASTSPHSWTREWPGVCGEVDGVVAVQS